MDGLDNIAIKVVKKGLSSIQIIGKDNSLFKSIDFKAESYTIVINSSHSDYNKNILFYSYYSFIQKKKLTV
ncbi:hypothetical protein EI427_24255 [Flammeovirga pectinis]|uniref:Uncharacterized protein n=1 Tax=Flammeovirga pectinis TaxID=2494373 RepID=A0A3Q9FRD2_9BACT|nr:hypothetical protein [Flammeovirga pectinis]AZQ65330.1 hypothetical protein EI427_24255 [Flammeovirga pectinis]